MHSPVRRLVAATAAIVALIPGSSALAVGPTPQPAYGVRLGHFRAVARFAVEYRGSGAFRTTYHARPPNPGGRPDTNDVRDSSAQRWSLRFSHPLTIPTCGGAPDPCARLTAIGGGRGPEIVTGRIHHVHVDGLYRNQNRAVSCSVHARASARAATIGVSYDAPSASFVFLEHDPVAAALTLLPSACPSQGDSLDLIRDNYFTPGFSFAPGYGPDRWFESGPIAIPAAVMHRAQTIEVPLADTPAGQPPRDCAVLHPTYEHCRTAGSWRGTMTFRTIG